MPELPEVQTVINYLKENILNKKITKIEITKTKFLKNITFDEFKKSLLNQKILNINRIGKYLIFQIENGIYMVVHLRMEGKFFIDQKLKPRKHDYITFFLEDGSILSYNDSRQFGTFHLSKNITELKEINKIAIDPLNENFNYDFVKEKISHSKKNIKALLLDQTVISGIGNIYASEILFDAKISPFKNGNELTTNELKKLVESSKKILNLALKHNGTTIHSFMFANNKTGEFVNYLKVVYQEKKPCQLCGTIIKREKQQSRSTFYCYKCQK